MPQLFCIIFSESTITFAEYFDEIMFFIFTQQMTLVNTKKAFQELQIELKMMKKIIIKFLE